MIILETERTKDDKFSGLTLRHPPAAHTRSISPLPDYDTSEAEHRKVITPSSRFKLDVKTWRAALYALCIYIFLTLTIAVPIIVIKLKDSRSDYNPPDPLWNIDNTNPPPPPPPRMAIAGTLPPSGAKTTCNNWQMKSNSPNSVIASFQLPPTGPITIRSNATYNSDHLNGTLSVSMNTYSNESSILFTVEMQSSSGDIQERMNVCFSEEGIDRGLSIYIPSDIGDGTLAFNISVVLPRVNSTIDSFVTYLPMFSQTYGDLRQYFNFDQFTLEGSSQPIICESLQALQISVTNTLASIQGSFNVTESLSLNSIRGPILTDITLSPRSIQTRPTLLRLSTGDSAINTSITLNAPPRTSIPSSSPVFIAQVNNFNGPLQLDVAYEVSSPASPLQFHVQNNIAQSTIYMDTRFRGSFFVETKLSDVFVHDTVDPWTNTSRIFDFDAETSDKAMGWIGWDSRPEPGQGPCESFVNALSALGPVNLTFGLWDV